MVDPYQQKCFVVAVLQWSADDGIAQVISDELQNLGHWPVLIQPDSTIPGDANVVITTGPYGNLIAFLSQLDNIPVANRPVTVHWNTEGMPDPRVPWPFIRAAALWRSRLDRLISLSRVQPNGQAYRWPFSALNTRVLRLRYVGDYDYATKHGWLSLLADSSAIYARLRLRNGATTVYAPWGSTPRWYADLGLERDVNVLWMGRRATRRRSKLLDRVRRELSTHGVEMYMADNVENPFIFDDNRTYILNRAKISLNLTRTWYDDNFSRFTMAAANRSLVVSEPLLPHCPAVEPGVHYVAAPAEKLAETILFYLASDEARERLVENAYQLVTTQLTLGRSVKLMVEAAQQFRHQIGLQTPG